MWIVISLLGGFVCLIIVALKYDSIQNLNFKIDKFIFKDEAIKVPIMIKLFLCFVIIILSLSFLEFPAKFSAVKKFNTAKNHEQIKKYDEAIDLYLKVFDEYPESDNLLARLFVTYYKKGDVNNAIPILKKLEGRELKKEIFEELNPIVKNLQEI